MLFFFFFNDTATTEIYTLSLHDALPICKGFFDLAGKKHRHLPAGEPDGNEHRVESGRSEEHTSELQSQSNLVCRLLLEKKKTQHKKVSTVPHIDVALASDSCDASRPLRA